ncbi:MAG TPA: outer membrane beta-barrel protein [Gemmatimonadaceae bacterium]|nr:outer membrane beta-barrel protein [Gemmatimonadaceae bacterium]
MKLILLAAMMAALARPALAQVGHAPSSSPYHDLVYKQEFTVYWGHFSGSRGSAGVAPGAGSLLGLRYGLHVGGPVQLAASFSRASSDRTILDPTKTGAARTVGSESWPLYLADLGMALNLTGRKSYHHFVPLVNAGLGAVSDGGKSGDVGGFKLGTRFALSFGAGIRWTPGGHYQLRADFTDYLYQLQYPLSYFAPPSGGGSPIFPATGSRKQWTHNPVLSIGISYVFTR